MNERMMKAKQPATTTQAQQAPVQVLAHFCNAHTHQEAQQLLWKWCILALKDSYDGLSTARTTELLTYYENLRAVITAVHQLHQQPLPAIPGPVTLPPAANNPAQVPGPVSAALDTLHRNLSHNWSLLICPPE